MVDDAKHPPSHAGSFGRIGTERPRVCARPAVEHSRRSERLNGLTNAPTPTWHLVGLLSRVGKYLLEITHEPIARHCALHQHAAPILSVSLAAHQIEFRKAIQRACDSLASIR
jgi:hypothetical protein